jgi:TolB-like protein
MMRTGDYAGAVTALRKAESRRPRDARIRRNLGIALLQAGNPAASLTALRAARDLDPRDRLTTFHLGRAAQQAGDDSLALAAYTAYLARPGKDAPEVRLRVRELSLRRIRAALRRAMQEEQRLALDAGSANTIAVPEFSTTVASDTLRPLARGLAHVMTTDLGRVPGLRVVERERLKVLADELRLAATPMVDSSEAPRLGRLLGARRFAQGGLAPTGGEIQLDALLLDAESGASQPLASPVAGPLSEVMALEKRLVFQVVEGLGVTLTPELRRAIGEPPTRSFDAFLAYSRGIDFEERGLPVPALAAYEEAVRLDPSFAAARERRDELAVTDADQSALDRQQLLAAFSSTAATERLFRTSAAIGLPTGPGNPRMTGISPVAKLGGARGQPDGIP